MGMRKERGGIRMLMGVIRKGNELIICRVGKGKRFGLMELTMRAIMKTVRRMVQIASSYGQTAHPTSVNSTKIIFMVRGRSILLMEISIRVNGSKAR